MLKTSRKGFIVQLLSHLRTTLTSMFIALAIAACGSSSDAESLSTQDNGQQPSIANDGNEAGDTTVQIDDNSFIDIDDSTSEEIGLMAVRLLRKVSGLRHASHLPLKENPAIGRLRVSISFLDKPLDLQLSLVHVNSLEENIIDLHHNDDYFFSGNFDAPEGDFFFKASGTSYKGDRFSVRIPRSYPSEP